MSSKRVFALGERAFSPPAGMFGAQLISQTAVDTAESPLERLAGFSAIVGNTPYLNHAQTI